jgi:hypothetical protein
MRLSAEHRCSAQRGWTYLTTIRTNGFCYTILGKRERPKEKYHDVAFAARSGHDSTMGKRIDYVDEIEGDQILEILCRSVCQA